MLLAASRAVAQTPVALFRSFVGHVNYQATGGSLRTQPNTGNACALAPSSTARLTGIPAGATIRAAYLYWGGSGATPDATVVLNGSARTAARTFTATYPLSGTDYDFFSGFADVTPLVAGNGTFTFSGLSVATGNPYCPVEAVVGGWGLIVVYEHPSEDLRAVNVFDGFQLFRGADLTLTLDRFRIPPSPINGKVTHITWEGDPQNSGSMNGVAERLTFDGNLLDDGLVPPGSAPTVQQFDGTVNTLGSTTTYGVDVDTYDVSAYLTAGDTSATTTYSTGADLVLLSAEVISFTTEPIVDLSITNTHTGDFTVGDTGSYVLRVGNAGPEPEANAVVVTDPLPAGLTFQSTSGSGWVCSAAGQDVTCTHPGPLAVGAALPDLTLTVGVGVAAAPSVVNTATVSSASVDADPANDSSADTTVVLASDLSTSTKSVVDLNGGDADPGDVLRYTITLIETGGVAATAVQVTDDVPGLVTSFALTGAPAGSTNASTGPPSGANGTGRLDVSNIVVPANGSATVEFEVTVAPSASPGDVIGNQATVGNPLGQDASPVAPNVVVSESQIPSGGTKTLYLYDTSTGDPNGFNQGARPYLSRTPPAGAQNDVALDGNRPPVVWSMTPALQAPLTIAAGSLPVTLYLSKGAGGGAPALLSLAATLGYQGTATGTIGTVTQTFLAPPSRSPDAFTFNIPLSADTTLPAGTVLTLTLDNVSFGGGTRRIRLFPTVGADRSRIDLPALTVINVDSAGTYAAAFPSTVARTSFGAGMSVAVRAQVSDPFGRFDIGAVRLDVLDANGAAVISAQPMAQVQAVGGAAASYELVVTLPAAAASGAWTYRVTALEGTEMTVTDTATGSFAVVAPLLTISKSVSTLSDPINGGANPKAIPGAVMLYSIDVSNPGPVPIDASTLSVRDVLPAHGALYVGGASPVGFVDGTPASGLSFTYASAVVFSNQPGGGPPYTYVPVPDAQGFDTAVTGIRVTPQGAFNANGGGGAPAFELRYRFRVD